jgi:uncharacterized membrane protein YfcA
LVGKLATGQMPFLMALPLLIGTMPAARWGSIVGKKNTQFFRWLTAIISATAVRVWLDII